MSEEGPADKNDSPTQRRGKEDELLAGALQILRDQISESKGSGEEIVLKAALMVLVERELARGPSQV